MRGSASRRGPGAGGVKQLFQRRLAPGAQGPHPSVPACTTLAVSTWRLNRLRRGGRRKECRVAILRH